MNIAHNKNILIFLLSSIGLIVFPHITHIPAALFAFFYLLLGWRFIGIWKPRWLPNKWVVFFLTVCGLILLYSQYKGILGRDAGTRLFVTALGLKLLEIKSERDLYLITYLAFVVAASQFLYEQSLPMAAYILFVCCVLISDTGLYQQQRTTNKSGIKNSEPYYCSGPADRGGIVYPVSQG